MNLLLSATTVSAQVDSLIAVSFLLLPEITLILIVINGPTSENI